jgi:hypothetical protein
MTLTLSAIELEVSACDWEDTEAGLNF